VHKALLHHQRCWRSPPLSRGELCFHVTFYELVVLTNDDDLESELWKSGRLHSDNVHEVRVLFGDKCRRMRESACTVSPDSHSKVKSSSRFLIE
jgi:hypothetical protein